MDNADDFICFAIITTRELYMVLPAVLHIAEDPQCTYTRLQREKTNLASSTRRQEVLTQTMHASQIMKWTLSPRMYGHELNVILCMG
jgi:hypothetical protein